MNELTYIPVGDYYVPDLKLPEETRPIGHWGRLHREYLRECRPIIYNDLVLSGMLWTYLADINEQEQERLEMLVEQMKTAEGITEKLKAEDQMEWVQRMNSIRDRAEEIVRRAFSISMRSLSVKCLCFAIIEYSLYTAATVPGGRSC